jgi:hypothetical protein
MGPVLMKPHLAYIFVDQVNNWGSCNIFPELRGSKRQGCVNYCDVCTIREAWHVIQYLPNTNYCDVFTMRETRHVMFFLFSLHYLFEIFLIRRRTQRDIATNVKASSCKVPVILVLF